MQKMYPVGLAGDDSVNFSILPIGGTTGKITAVRVQDIQRDIWFNWDNGIWSTPTPSCAPGAGALYISFGAVNTGAVSGNITLTLKKMELGPTGEQYETILAQVTAYAAPGGLVGLEWTGDMPPNPIFITCYAEP